MIVVPYRSFGELQFSRDFGTAAAIAGQAEDLALAIGQRIRVAPGFRRKLRINGPAARVNAADRVRELVGR